VPPNEAMVEEVEEEKTCTKEVLKGFGGVETPIQ
jgi:hypothetical protein